MEKQAIDCLMIIYNLLEQLPAAVSSKWPNGARWA